MKVKMVGMMVGMAVMWSAPAAGQGIAVSGHAGTLGFGVDVSLGLTGPFALRAGASIMPLEPSYEMDDVEYTVAFASPYYMGLLDIYPTGSGFRLSGGAVYFTRDHELSARLIQPAEIGGQTYSPQDVGTLTGVFDTREIAPYVGIGFGRPGGRRGVGLALDLGVAIQGSPDVRLVASGPVSSVPSFQVNLAREELNIEDDARPFRFYPVLSLGLVVGF